MKKWNFSKRIYENYTVPTTWHTPLIAELDEIINCADCGKQITYGDCYTSLTIHTNTGMGYPVCEKCYEKEWEGRRRSRMNKQEALDIFVSCATLDCEHCNMSFRGCEDKPRFNEMRDMVISALEKQISKKPEFYGDNEDGKLLCPSCGEDLWDIKECGFIGCPYCLQAIDWRNEDE